jgi:putative glutamine amidotransferase
MNADFRGRDGQRPPYLFVCAGYFDRILAAGGIPVILPPLTDRAEIEAVVDKLDAFVLVGGPDLDPRRDGFMLHATVRPMDGRREDFDRMLIDVLAKKRMPTFGIGAGMQLLNVAMGGNLFLHIPEDVPAALPHRDPQDPAHRHGLEIVPGSIMGRVYGDGEIRVNSMHHMAIDELASGFEVTARCPDGIIEAIESTCEDWFAMGTQFHPEGDSASALDGRIFEEFLTAAVNGAVRMVA